MKTIELDDDVYAFIASQTERIGESASEILRRLLPMKAIPKNAQEATPQKQHELSELLASPTFKFQPSVDRFLSILAEAYKQKTADFEKVRSLRGRNRVYFADSEKEILQSGTSTYPKQIPHTKYWVMTNASNATKAQMAHDVLRLLGFSEDARKAARASIR